MLPGINVDEIEESTGKLNEFGKILQEVGLISEDMSKEVGGGYLFAPETWDAEGILEFYNKLVMARDMIEEWANGLTEAEQEVLSTAETIEGLNSMISAYEEEGDVATYATAKLREAFAAFNGEAPTSREEIERFIDGMMASAGVGEAFRDVIEDMAYDAFPGLEDSIGDARIATNEFEEAAKTAEQELANMKSHMENLANIDSAYNSLADAVSEYNSTGQLSISTLQQLLSLEPQYLQYLVNENGQLSINSEGFLRLAHAELDEMEIAEKRMLFKTINSFQREAEDQDG